MTETLETFGKSKKRHYINENLLCDFCNYSLDSNEVFEYVFTCECCGKVGISVCNNCITIYSAPELRRRYSKITHKSIDLV